jgi:hypothetical protein
MKHLFFLLLLPFFLKAQVPIAQTYPNPFSYTLPTSYKTVSKAIYLNGVLVTTVTPDAEVSGKHTYYWNGVDDLRNLRTIGLNYTMNITANNLTYTWEGGIGNNSTMDTGMTVHRYYGTIACMVEVGNYMYYGTDFSESDDAHWKLLKSTPLQKIRIFPNGTTSQQPLFVCANANNVFWVGREYYAVGNFVIATAVSNDALVTFSSGVSFTGTPPMRSYPSVIDYNTLSQNGLATGAAVQQSGNQYLFVAHSSQNYIKVYKTSGNTGNLVQTISITTPGNLFLENDATLWVSQGTTLTKYTVNSDGTITTTGSAITGFANIVGLSIHSGDLCVADAGNQQIVKRYNSTTLASTGTIGQLGGYATSPTVVNNKFYMNDVSGSIGLNQITGTVFLAHQSDSSLWVGDPGNFRYQHFNKSGTYLNNIMCLPRLYDVNVCLNGNTAVFGKMLEYTIDYTQPLSSGWTLTNNWGYNEPSGWDFNYPINAVIKMSNGRRYAMFKGSTGVQYYWGELTTGGVRYHLVTLPGPVPSIDSIGNIYSWSSTGSHPSQVYTLKKYTLTGFDGSNNPTYSGASTVATIPIGANGATTSQVYNYTTSGNLILYNFSTTTYGGGANKQFHLTGYNVSSSKILWNASPETFTAYTGDYPFDGSFDIGNGVKGAGNTSNVVGNNIFWGYRGEFWKASETGIINHYNDKGLLLGIFGVLGPKVASKEAAFGYASNQETIATTAVDTNIYVYVNDESKHSFIHRWKVSNLSSIYTQTVTQSLTNRVFVPTVNSTDLIAGYPAGWTLSHADYYNSSTDYFTTITGTTNYKLGSTPSLIFTGGHIGSGVIYSKVRALPSYSATNLDITGSLDFSHNTMMSISPGNGEFYIDVLDNAHKVICRIEGFSNSTIKINGVTYGPFVNVYGSSAFVIKKSGSGVYVQIDFFGTKIAHTYSLFDPTASLNASYISWNWAFGPVIRFAQFGINSLQSVQ